jgi:hypothetical protein
MIITLCAIAISTLIIGTMKKARTKVRTEGAKQLWLTCEVLTLTCIGKTSMYRKNTLEGRLYSSNREKMCTQTISDLLEEKYTFDKK